MVQNPCFLFFHVFHEGKWRQRILIMNKGPSGAKVWISLPSVSFSFLFCFSPFFLATSCVLTTSILSSKLLAFDLHVWDPKCPLPPFTIHCLRAAEKCMMSLSPWQSLSWTITHNLLEPVGPPWCSFTPDLKIVRISLSGRRKVRDIY